MSGTTNIPQFDLGIKRGFGAAGAVLGGELFVVGANTSYDYMGNTFPLMLTTLDVSEGFSASWGDASSWTSTTLSFGNLHSTSCYSRCGTDIAQTPTTADGTQSDALYLFWNQFVPGSKKPPGILMAAWTTGPGDEGGDVSWSNAYTLLQQDGQTVVNLTGGNPEDPGTTSDVSVTAFGPGTFLIACPGSQMAGGSGLYLAVYETASIPQTGTAYTWAATWQTFLGIEQLQDLAPTDPSGAPYTVTGLGMRASIAWFIGGSSSATEPLFYLALFLNPTFSTSTGSNVYWTVMPLGSDGTPGATDALTMSAVPEASVVPRALRDVAGRILAYSAANEAGEIACSIYNTYTAPPASGSSPQPASAAAIAASGASSVPPETILFVDTVNHTSCTDTPPGTSCSVPATCYSVYQVLLYNGSFYNGTCYCQVDFFGTIKVTEPVNLGSPVNVSSQTLAQLTGIIDGPIPLPAENILNAVIPANGCDGGDIVYGTEQDSETSHDVDMSMIFGIQSNGQCMKGIGPAWNIALGGGVTWGWGNGTTTTLSLSKIQKSTVTGETSGDSTYGTAILSSGTCWGQTATLLASGFTFIDANNNLIVDTFGTQAQVVPAIAALTAQVQGPVQEWSFTPYMAVPGQMPPPLQTDACSLAVYTPHYIQRTMSALGYTGDDYFQEILLPNAYVFAPGNDSYLQFSWAPNGGANCAYTSAANSFTELGGEWSASVYAGVSGGEGVELFGFGEDFESQILAGFTYSGTCNTTDTSGNSWGISVAAGSLGSDPNSWGPPAITSQPPGMSDKQYKHVVTGYSFILLLLPVPAASSGLPANYWTTELLNYGANFDPPNTLANQIDPGSACWRITCVVINYQTAGGRHYKYSGSLQPNADQAAKGRLHASSLLRPRLKQAAGVLLPNVKPILDTHRPVG